MNKYVRSFLHRGLMFGGFGPIIIGIVYLVLGIPAIFLMYYFKGDNVARALSLVYSVVLIANVVYSCNSVSKELQNKFDEKGIPKE